MVPDDATTPRGDEPDPPGPRREPTGADAAGPGGASSGSAPLALPHLRWRHRPPLRRPVMITAFEGWNDAGSAATSAARFLVDAWSAVPFCDVDPEELFDFSTTRPTVRFDDEGIRHVDWPENTWHWAHLGDDLDVVVLLGTEPQLRWRTFSHHVTALARHLDVRLVVSLGALLAEVPHSRPVSVYGAAYDPAVADELALTPSHYEGPTGIVGVLHDAYRAQGLSSASLWAAVPSYVPSAPSPKAALALVARVTHLLGTTVDTTELSEAAAEYETQLDEAVAEDDESLAYVARLEQAWDESDLDEGPSGSGREGAADTELMAEIERYLRDQRE